MEKNCRACAFSYLDMESGNIVCGHEDSGIFGIYLHSAKAPYREGEHCGPNRSKFEQHPMRQENGDLK